MYLEIEPNKVLKFCFQSFVTHTATPQALELIITASDF